MIDDHNGAIRAGAEGLLSVAGAITSNYGALVTAKAMAAASAAVLVFMSDEDTEKWFSVVRSARAEMRKAEVTS